MPALPSYEAPPDRSGVEFAKALFQLAMAYPEAETIHLVMDNLSTHSRKSLTDLCGEEFGGEIRDCFTPHYTPAHGSWPNQAEIEIGLFARQAWASAAFRTWRGYAAKRPLGIAGSTATGSKSTGGSTARRHVAHLATKDQLSSGQN